MSDQDDTAPAGPPTEPSPSGADSPEPGWYADAYGRHEYRYWDGSEWSDQVSDGGQVSTDPPTGQAAAGPGGGVPTALLVVLGLVAAVVVAIVLILTLGGDDGGGTGTFAGEITDDDQVDVRTVHLEAGEALRATVDPESDLDPVLGFGIEPDAAGEGFLSLFARGNDDADVDAPQAAFGDQFDRFFEVFSDDDLSEAFSDDYTDLRTDLVEEVPDAEDAGIVFYSQDPGFEGDDEYGVLAAPVEADYTVLVTAFDDTEGEYELTIEDTGRPEDFDFDEDRFDPEDEIDDEDYEELFFAHQDFFCEEDFFADEFLSGSSFLCEADDFDEYFSDLTDFDFTDFTDFTDDFTDDFTEPPSPCELAIEGDPIEIGDTVDGELAGPEDFAAFELTGDGNPFDVAVDQTDQTFDPIVTICDAQGLEVDRDDDGGDYPNSLLQGVSTVDGEPLLIVVTGFSGSTGTFEMRVRP